MDVHRGKPKLKKSGGEGQGEASGKLFGDSRPNNRGREARAAISKVCFQTVAKTFSLTEPNHLLRMLWKSRRLKTEAGRSRS